MYAPSTRTLDVQCQARQFEFHDSEPILAVGSIDGAVCTFDWEANRVLQRSQVDAARQSPVLALSWLHLYPRRFLAAAASGKAMMYEASFDVDADSAEPGEVPVVHEYVLETRDLTSINCNCSDDLMVSCGYNTSVHIHDMETGQLVRELTDIHENHINISRFANHLPHVLLTCSFDKKLKVWDNRVDKQVPIYTVPSDTSYVMACFSPNDMYFLTSGVDNNVCQYTTVDGRLNLAYDIPRSGSSICYTRSYYANGGSTIVSGSSFEDVLHVCSATTGKLIDSVRLHETRRCPALEIQSLRGNSIRSNRCSVLLYYRTSEKPYELIDVDLNKGPDGEDIPMPFSIGALSELADDLEALAATPLPDDVDLVLHCEDGSSLPCHSAFLSHRWPWLKEAQAGAATSAAASASEPGGLDDSDSDDEPAAASASAVAHLDVPLQSKEHLDFLLRFLYSDRLPLHTLTRSLVFDMYPHLRKQLGVPRLAGILEKHLKDTLSLSNAVESFLFARRHDAELLQSSCVDFIARNLDYFRMAAGDSEDELRHSLTPEGYVTMCELHERAFDADPVDWFFVRTGHTCTRVGHRYFYIGGFRQSGVLTLNEIPVYNARSDTWTIFPAYGNIPDALYFHASAFVHSPTHGNVIVSVGVNPSSTSLHDEEIGVWFLHVDSMTWSNAADHEVREEDEDDAPDMDQDNVPPALERHAMCAVGTTVWVYGGRFGNSRTGDGAHISGATFSYNVETLQWTQRSAAGFQPPPIFCHTLTYVPEQHVLVMIGGIAHQGMISSVFTFDLLTLRWSPTDTSPGLPFSPRCNHTTILVPYQANDANDGGSTGDSVLVVFGGSFASAVDLEYVFHNDLWALSPRDWRWRKFVPQAGEEVHLPEPGACPSAMWADPYLMIWGGDNTDELRRSCSRINLLGCIDRADTPSVTDLPDEVTAPAWEHVALRVSDLYSPPVVYSKPPTLLADATALFRCEMRFSLEHAQRALETRQVPPQRVLLVVGGTPLLVRRVVLKIRCESFRVMLSSSMQESRDGVVELDDVPLSAFLIVLGFLHTGDIDLSLLKGFQIIHPAMHRSSSSPGQGQHSSVVRWLMDEMHIPPEQQGCEYREVLQVADRFGLHQLSVVMELVLTKSINSDNIFDVLQFADFFHLTTLRNHAVMHAITNFGDLSAAPGFAELEPSTRQLIRDKFELLLARS